MSEMNATSETYWNIDFFTHSTFTPFFMTAKHFSFHTNLCAMWWRKIVCFTLINSMINWFWDTLRTCRQALDSSNVITINQRQKSNNSEWINEWIWISRVLGALKWDSESSFVIVIILPVDANYILPLSSLLAIYVYLTLDINDKHSSKGTH